MPHTRPAISVTIRNVADETDMVRDGLSSSALMQILPCGYDTQDGAVGEARDFLTDVAQSTGQSGLALLEEACRRLNGDPLARRFADRLSVEILMQAGKVASDLNTDEEEPAIKWWPIAEGMKAGDELLLLLSPAPIASVYMNSIANDKGLVGSSNNLRDVHQEAKNFGKYLPARAFSDVRLAPYRLLTGGGIYGRGRLLGEPYRDPNEGFLRGPIGEIALFENPVDPTDLGLPSAWSLEWSVLAEGAGELPSVSLAEVEKLANGRPRSTVPQPQAKMGANGSWAPTARPPDGWELFEKIGAGGQGSVFRARRGDEVAVLKLFTSGLGEKASQRADEIVRLGTTLKHQHPNILWYLEVLTGEDGSTWVRMDDGGADLFSLRHQLSLEQKLSALIDAGEALSHLHAHGVAWLDFKPENLLVDETGTCRIADPDLLEKATPRSGTVEHMPATPPPDAADDLYAFLVTCIRVLARPGSNDLARGAKLASLLGHGDPLETDILNESGVSKFKTGPSVRGLEDDDAEAADVAESSHPARLGDALRELKDARDLAAKLDYARRLDSALMDQLATE